MRVLFLYLAQISLGILLYVLGQGFWQFVLLVLLLFWAVLLWWRDRVLRRLGKVPPELSTSEFIDLVYEKRFGSEE
jgi:hypothetical protein